MLAPVPAADPSLVLQPSFPFADIARVLEEAGFVPGPDDAVTPPAVPGEREFAYWTAAGGGAMAHYSFNPVVLLRVLSLSGLSARRWAYELAPRLPQLGAADVLRLIQSTEIRDILLGLYAAAEMKAFLLLPAIDPLRIHTDRRVSQTAGQVAEKLGLAMVSAGAQRLAELQRRQPGRSALFPLLGDAATRRETLIWLLRDSRAVTDETVKVLRSALNDDEWRVRVTAMVVTARLSVSALWPEVRRIELPATSRSGLDRRERSLMMAMRKAILAELADDPMPTGADGGLMRVLRDAVAGRPAQGDEKLHSWVEAWVRVES